MSHPTEATINCSDLNPQFDSIWQVSPYGAEYWSARDLDPILDPILGYGHDGYDTWRRFEDTIERAKAACRNAGEDVENHFPGAGKIVALGSGVKRELKDYGLSRYGCYWVAMNGDPRKLEIAAA